MAKSLNESTNLTVQGTDENIPNEKKVQKSYQRRPNYRNRNNASKAQKVVDGVTSVETVEVADSNKKVPQNGQKAVRQNSQQKTNNQNKPKSTNKGQSANKQKKGGQVRIVPLGGLGEIGKNITLYESGNDMFLVDCGMAFPDEEMPGIDIVLPDFSYLIKNRDKIRGLVVTHGHEDHIGAIPYLLKELKIPVYGTALTLGLISGKLREHKILGDAKLKVLKAGDTVKLGCFKIELIHVNHSIPDAVALAITTPAGVVVQTGDFKIDTTPIDGDVIDLARFAELGKQGVLALLSDSTNAERPGFTPSERIVGDSFTNLFKQAENNRIIIATFSSNIHRIQQIIDEAVRCKRKVAISGRSMENVVSVASELGYLTVPAGVLIDIELINKFTPGEVVIITTGSQGEPMSALRRMAFGDHRKVNVGIGDTIIISATPIPGNEKLVGKVVNELLKLGAEVVYEKMYDVHVSGHACQEELKIIFDIVKPKFFIPVHGEQKHLVKHASLAKSMGMDPKNILITSIGNVIELRDDSMRVVDTVTSGRVLVDGLGVGDVGSVVLRDRKHLAEDGIFVVTLSMDSVTHEVVSGPEVISRGFIYMKESEQLILDAKEIACDVLERCYISKIRDRNVIKGKIRDGISKFLYEKTRRSPMILPIIMDI